MRQNLNVWVITEGIAGTENQCLGVAEQLQSRFNTDIKTVRVSLKKPWDVLSPYITPNSLERLINNASEYTAPWPDVILASGRKAIAPALSIKKKAGNACLVVQLQDPRWAAGKFDLVAVPFHDRYRGENALITYGAPNRITVTKLQEERAVWALPKTWTESKKPVVAFLVGGKSKAYDFDATLVQGIINQINLLSEGYDVLVTASRRTGTENLQTFTAAFEDNEAVYFWDGEGYNPYFAYLAHADHIIVTPDSTSMLSEAASTGKPTYCLNLDGGNAKFKRFHDHMREIGAAKFVDLGETTLDFKPNMILSDAALVAEKISELLAEKRG